MRLRQVAAFCTVAAMTVAPALAQSSNSAAGHTTSMAGQTTSTAASTKPDVSTLQQSLKQGLEKAGFTDITVSPASFNVHATNAGGQKVYMLVSPDSLTEIASLPVSSSTAKPSNDDKSTSSK